MSKLVLVFNTPEGQVNLECDRVEDPAEFVRINDFIACPHVGFVQVRGVRSERGLVYISDPHGHEHLYSSATVLNICRPREAL